MTFRKKVFIALCGSVFGFSCTKDLNRTSPNALTADDLYKNESGYRSSLAKLYGGLALTGNSGPDGSGDLGGIDEGFSSYIRTYWYLQELPTDEAVIGWNDQTIKDLHEMDWSPTEVFNRALYSRIFYQITLANAFIRESSDDKLSGRGISGADATKVKGYQAEARFLRALSYLHAMDLYGSPTFVTEQDPIGAFLPPQKSRAELFTFVESELKAVESLVPDPKQNEYARADKAAVWMTLANLYLNAKIYTGTERYTDAVTYSSKVIAAAYTLEPNYANLFLADNNKSNELIFAVAFDGTKTRTWGGTTFLVHAPVGGDMNVNEYGIDFGWGGLRTTKAFVQKFPDPSGATDKRAMFQSAGQTLEINDISDFRNGYSIKKWKNITSTGANGSSLTWADTDFPMFRLAEAYLIYAEAVLRGGTGGSATDALTYINNLRQRAYGNTSGNISSTQLTLDFILDERARELQWEGKRRTDLVRYDEFTTSAYLWPWKGGVKDGTAVSHARNLFPIPAAEINTNPNLIQNEGY
jgi:starch-binding outer membrane protein, SusD/RagB family